MLRVHIYSGFVIIYVITVYATSAVSGQRCVPQKYIHGTSTLQNLKVEMRVHDRSIDHCCTDEVRTLQIGTACISARCEGTLAEYIHISSFSPHLYPRNFTIHNSQWLCKVIASYDTSNFCHSVDVD